jgi:hypothetical protein
MDASEEGVRGRVAADYPDHIDSDVADIRLR